MEKETGTHPEYAYVLCVCAQVSEQYKLKKMQFLLSLQYGIAIRYYFAILWYFAKLIGIACCNYIAICVVLCCVVLCCVCACVRCVFTTVLIRNDRKEEEEIHRGGGFIVRVSQAFTVGSCSIAHPGFSLVALGPII